MVCAEVNCLVDDDEEAVAASVNDSGKNYGTMGAPAHGLWFGKMRQDIKSLKCEMCVILLVVAAYSLLVVMISKSLLCFEMRVAAFLCEVRPDRCIKAG